jgi:putative membrane protein insertion efficiency factor
MQCTAKFIMRILTWIVLFPVYFYKYAISPLTPASCRHVPTCSEYAVLAVKMHGPFKGFWLGVRRILRCHPWGTHGYDPVPPRAGFNINQWQPEIGKTGTEKQLVK